MSDFRHNLLQLRTCFASPKSWRLTLCFVHYGGVLVNRHLEFSNSSPKGFISSKLYKVSAQNESSKLNLPPFLSK